MTFDEWFKTVKEDVEDNCENRMDQFDAEGWMREAYLAGEEAGQESVLKDL